MSSASSDNEGNHSDGESLNRFTIILKEHTEVFEKSQTPDTGRLMDTNIFSNS